MESQNNKNKQSEKERETAESVRKRSIERPSQTRDREGLESSKKKRRSGIGLVEYLQEKGTREESQKRLILTERSDIDIEYQRETIRA